MLRAVLVLLASISAVAPAHAQEAVAPAPVSAQLANPRNANVAIAAHVLEPDRIDPTDERLSRLGLPEGFEDLVAPEKARLIPTDEVPALREEALQEWLTALSR